jgi:hypothetical protein
MAEPNPAILLEDGADRIEGLRVESKAELSRRIRKYFTEVSRSPVVFSWKYMLDQHCWRSSQQSAMPGLRGN